jgi:hypothetical protein
MDILLARQYDLICCAMNPSNKNRAAARAAAKPSGGNAPRGAGAGAAAAAAPAPVGSYHVAVLPPNGGGGDYVSNTAIGATARQRRLSWRETQGQAGGGGNGGSGAEQGGAELSGNGGFRGTEDSGDSGRFPEEEALGE